MEFPPILCGETILTSVKLKTMVLLDLSGKPVHAKLSIVMKGMNVLTETASKCQLVMMSIVEMATDV